MTRHSMKANSQRSTPVGRLLFFNGGTRVYGFERRICTLMHALQQTGYSVTSTVSGWNDGEFPRSLDRYGIPHHNIFLGWYYLSRPRWTLDTLRRLPGALIAYDRLLRTFNPDAVFHASYRSLLLTGWMSRVPNILLIPDQWSDSWEWSLVRALQPMTAAYITNSATLRDLFVSKGLPRKKVVAIQNAHHFAPQNLPPATGSDRRLAVIGIVGQVIDRKGHHVAFRALSQVLRAHPSLPVRLRVVGDGSPEKVEELKQVAATLRIDHAVEWRGYVSSKDEMYQDIDFLITPTIGSEPFANVVVEAAGYSKPAIASAIGGMGEIILHGRTGLLVPPNDPVALASAMERLLLHPEETAELGRTARLDYEQRFNLELIAGRYSDLIQAVIHRKDPISVVRTPPSASHPPVGIGI